MIFHWATVLYQLIFITLIFLFFYSLFRFVRKIMIHIDTTKQTLERLENKIDLINRRD
ncbi:DUF4083 family protein [Paenibacillus dokdonensis]|uniref:DUF4083 family protein n=1 Tax=Paenibacillus dokdonensis TaxID=2567944 RepID=UPI001457A432